MDTIVTLAFLFAIFGLIAYVVTIFNGLIALKNDIAKAWSNIDILLKQRHDELSSCSMFARVTWITSATPCRRSRKPAACINKL